MIKDKKDEFKGLCVLAWDNPVHFPREMFEEFGFLEIEKDDYISLMYLPFEEGSEKPSLLGPNFEPLDPSEERRLAVDLGYSNRCPYSIHNKEKVEKAVSEIKKTKIELNEYRRDDKEEAVRYSISPWNWDWMFVNGEKVPHYKMDLEEVKDLLKRSFKG